MTIQTQQTSLEENTAGWMDDPGPDDRTPGHYFPRERSAAADRTGPERTGPERRQPDAGLQGSSAGWLLRFVFQTSSPEPKPSL